MSKNNIDKTLADALKTRRGNDAVAKLILEGFCKMGAAERYGENLPALARRRARDKALKAAVVQSAFPEGIRLGSRGM